MCEPRDVSLGGNRLRRINSFGVIFGFGLVVHERRAKNREKERWLSSSSAIAIVRGEACIFSAIRVSCLKSVEMQNKLREPGGLAPDYSEFTYSF